MHASRETLCLSKDTCMDGKRSPETNIYLTGAHVTVDTVGYDLHYIYPAQKFTD